MRNEATGSNLYTVVYVVSQNVTNSTLKKGLQHRQLPNDNRVCAVLYILYVPYFTALKFNL